jgi:hypothetical protein
MLPRPARPDVQRAFMALVVGTQLDWHDDRLLKELTVKGLSGTPS